MQIRNRRVDKVCWREIAQYLPLDGGRYQWKGREHLSINIKNDKENNKSSRKSIAAEEKKARLCEPTQRYNIKIVKQTIWWIGGQQKVEVIDK